MTKQQALKQLREINRSTDLGNSGLDLIESLINSIYNGVNAELDAFIAEAEKEHREFYISRYGNDDGFDNWELNSEDDNTSWEDGYRSALFDMKRNINK
jgi:hypothetical protein